VKVGEHYQKVALRGGDLVSTEAAKINGYDAEVWKREAKPFDDFKIFLTRKLPMGSVAIPVGHNVGFDRDMIDLSYYKKGGRNQFLPLSYRKVDTIALAMTLRVAGVIDVPDVRLGTIAAALGIPAGKAHTAMDDCLVAKALFERFVAFLKRAKVAKVEAASA
jgi:DNA polymerase III epsilon subunit-like protein